MPHQTNLTEVINTINSRIPGKYSTNCPAHDDSRPSLSITIKDDGKPIWKCHAGCSQEAVQAALIQAGMQWHTQNGHASGKPTSPKIQKARAAEYQEAEISQAREMGTLIAAKDSHGLEEALNKIGVVMRYNLRRGLPEYYQYKGVPREILRAGSITHDTHLSPADQNWREVNDRIEELWREQIAEEFVYPTRRGVSPLRYGKESWESAVKVILHRTEQDPFKEWLERTFTKPGTEETGTPVIERLDTWLCELFGAPDDKLTRWASQYLFMGCIERAYEPGKRFKVMPVLVGAQGTGKSPVLAHMLPPGPRWAWFSDSLDLSKPNKERIEALQGRVIVEVQEMAGTNRAELQSLKAFLSRVDDGATRLAYRRNPETMLRRCILAGTADRPDFLPNDEAGLTRFLPIQLEHGGNVERFMDEHRNELWQEAYYRYHSEETAAMPRKLAEAQANQAEQYRNRDVVVEDAVAALAEKGPFTLAEIASKVDVDFDIMNRRNEKRLGAALRQHGWGRRQMRIDGGSRKWCWEKPM